MVRSVDDPVGDAARLAGGDPDGGERTFANSDDHDAGGPGVPHVADVPDGPDCEELDIPGLDADLDTRDLVEAADADGGEPPDGPEPSALRHPEHDAWWYDALVRSHSRALVRYFARRAPISDAEDLAADVLLTAWRRRDDVPADAVLPWLYRTAGFVLANYRRKHSELPVEELPEPTVRARVGTDPEISALFDDELRGALASVSERDREILLLHAWEGLNGAELAEVLGISRSGADAALSRARKRLREAWGERLEL